MGIEKIAAKVKKKVGTHEPGKNLPDAEKIMASLGRFKKTAGAREGTVGALFAKVRSKKAAPGLASVMQKVKKRRQ